MTSGAPKLAVMARICKGEPWMEADGTNYRVGRQTVHVRFCSADRSRSPRYKFNINPATLRADHEVWICGSPDAYYLLPHSVIRSIYADPGAYPDRRHPEIRVVSVDAVQHVAVYAKGAQALDLRPYFQKTL